MSAVKVSLSHRNKIPLPATSLGTKQLRPGDDRSYTYISRMTCSCSNAAQDLRQLEYTHNS